MYSDSSMSLTVRYTPHHTVSVAIVTIIFNLILYSVESDDRNNSWNTCATNPMIGKLLNLLMNS